MRKYYKHQKLNLSMEHKLIWLLIFWALLIPFVSADIIVPYFEITFILLPIVLIIELAGFWFFTNKIFLIKVKPLQTFQMVIVANLITYLIGTVIDFLTLDYIDVFRDFFPYSIFIAFILSVIIEYFIFSMFFIKSKIKKINLFWISGIINLASYLLLFILFINLEK